MANAKLDNLSKEEIREAVKGLSNGLLKAKVSELSARFEISENRIYELTKDLRPARRKRADAGRRDYDWQGCPHLRFIFEQVVNQKLRPERALLNAKLNGYEGNISVGTIRKYMNEIGISRKQNKKTREAYRRWEASAPGEIFQFDISGLKTRWLDVATRKLLHLTEAEVSDNHPQRNKHRVRVWKFCLTDDFSRRKFIRFVGVYKPNSTHVVDFLLEAFRTLGVPKKLYTDRDRIILSKRTERAAMLLDKAFESSGGFQIAPHAAHNAKATGKVERMHQIVEEDEKLIGVYEYYNEPITSLDQLNDFAREICEDYDWIKHSTTGVEPMLRWQSQLHAVRIAPDAILDSAFKAQEFTVEIYHDLTIKVLGEVIQLPRGRDNEGVSLVDYAGQKATAILPADGNWLVIITADGNEFTMDRMQWQPDAAGEYKALPESKADAARKLLKDSAKERRAAIRSGEAEPIKVAHINAKVERAATPITFPKPQIAANTSVIPGAAIFTEKTLDKFAAYDWLIEQGFWSEPSGSDIQWWKELFANCEEISEAELRAAIESEQQPAAVIPFERKLKLA